ncbi:carbohydrate ABC transporter permease [Cryobacterium sp. PH29-G1]|uniref:carbohydrate ABC transporter permease n=1 Tax=Cryobacterium sp. PH29-G1 TaxID=3046211 RepID=UPI0024B8D982|nr:carbohydrate ABC transporter permease [Cryobacterium sp. PH29-G1]MDJ0348696.1 carbohydrate ABC transporter permease [Cryobacterium sp. PH29-G1]
MRWTRFSSTTTVYLVLVLGALFTIGPFLLSILTAFKTREQFAQQSVLSWPDPFTLENFALLLTGPAQFGRAIVITVLAAVLILVGQLIFSILAAYAFARVDFPGRQVLFWVYLSTLMIPPVVLVVPLYLMMTEAGLRNSFWSLVLPFAFASPYAIFLLREYFRGIPQELIDAARLDGANTLDILVEIVVPLSRPIIATLTLITIVSHWNSFMWPLVVTTGTQWRVVTVATASLQSQFNGNWTLVMAATTLALVPLLVLFLMFQRSFVRSITIAGSA